MEDAMKEHSVIAEMIDANTGTRYFPGQAFTPADEDQAERLIKARCIREGRDRAAIQRDQLNNDGLFDNTVAELREIAAAERINLGDATKKADIVAAIRAARAA
jgi:hypothetical protein